MFVYVSVCVCVLPTQAFINRNAYVLIGVKGSNYCVSAMRAVQLIVAVRIAYITLQKHTDTRTHTVHECSTLGATEGVLPHVCAVLLRLCVCVYRMPSD